MSEYDISRRALRIPFSEGTPDLGKITSNIASIFQASVPLKNRDLGPLPASADWITAVVDSLEALCEAYDYTQDRIIGWRRYKDVMLTVGGARVPSAYQVTIHPPRIGQRGVDEPSRRLSERYARECAGHRTVEQHTQALRGVSVLLAALLCGEGPPQSVSAQSVMFGSPSYVWTEEVHGPWCDEIQELWWKHRSSGRQKLHYPWMLRMPDWGADTLDIGARVYPSKALLPKLRAPEMRSAAALLWDTDHIGATNLSYKIRYISREGPLSPGGKALWGYWDDVRRLERTLKELSDREDHYSNIVGVDARAAAVLRRLFRLMSSHLWKLHLRHDYALLIHDGQRRGLSFACQTRVPVRNTEITFWGDEELVALQVTYLGVRWCRRQDTLSAFT